MSKKQKLLTGAEVLVSILESVGIKNIFAYPGTSELVLCDSILRRKTISLINGRGDKESAFMASGGCMMTPLKAAAILHGARGSTNALGAISDACRNEVPILFIVGLPSTASQPFLPPHGEWNLIKKLGNFVKASTEITDISLSSAKTYCSKIYEALQSCIAYPQGPVIIGIPQDVSEKKWIPENYVSYINIKKAIIQRSSQQKVKTALNLIKKSSKPLLYIDDFFYKYQNSKKIISQLAESLGSPIFQVLYGRGPMLFERLTQRDSSHFLGCYDPTSSNHQKIMFEADLLITIEDRNMYPRVVNKLPQCKKIAFTSNPTMTRKNNYLMRNDLVVEGNVGIIIEEIASELKSDHKRKSWVTEKHKRSFSENQKDSAYSFMRYNIAKILSEIFINIKSPMLVDDSQMFGGLLAEEYELFPSKLRVFGDHGAFIGGGLALATGLAKCEARSTVFCTLGDQSFTNAVQGLIAAVEQKIKIIYIICNNSKSVSLMKQILSQDSSAFETGKNTFLNNAPINYSAITKSLGIPTHTIPYIPNHKNKFYAFPDDVFKKALSQALIINGPSFIELILPSDPEAWKGIWSVKGNEE